MMRPFLLAAVSLGVVLPGLARCEETQLRQQAAEALRKATDFFTKIIYFSLP
ncbi:MAG: hypothetical protein ABIP48_32070 [Planctomycetota bacterium]